jgi:hypothetical protein
VASRKAPRLPVLSRRLARGGEVPTGGPGWRIVTPINDASASPASFLAPSAAPRGPARSLALITGLSRLTFNLVLLGIIIAILAIPISIGLSHLAAQRPQVVATAPVGTPRPLPTPYPGAKLLQTAAFALDYPASWKQGTFTTTLTGAGQSVGVSGTTFQTGGNVTFAIAAFTAQPENVLQDMLSAGLIQVTPGNPDSFSPIDPPHLGPTLDGVRWFTEEFTYNLVSGRQTTRLQTVALVASRGDTSYLIVYQAPASQFGSDVGPDFQPMLNSFRFRP